jgi:hypothetical protein
MGVSRLRKQAQLAADSSDPLPQSKPPGAAPAVAGAAFMLVQLLVLDVVLEGCEVQSPQLFHLALVLPSWLNLLPGLGSYASIRRKR